MLIYKIRFHSSACIKKRIFNLYFKNKLSIGKNTTWRRNFSLWIEKNARVEIGNDCFFNNNCSITCFSKITIGSNTIFGENVKIYDQNHKFASKDVPFSQQGYSIGEVCIGKNCWIGSNVVILKDTQIGDNCVIGAGVVLSNSVPAGSIVRNNNQYCIEKIRG